MNGQSSTAHSVHITKKSGYQIEPNRIRVEVSDRTRHRSDQNKISATPGLHKKYIVKNLWETFKMPKHYEN